MAKVVVATMALAIFYRLALGDELHANAIEDYVDVHNQARAEVGVGPLKWSQDLAKAADELIRHQNDIGNCPSVNLDGVNYGANMFWTSAPNVIAREAVEYWVAEKKYYDYANNSCAGDHQCGVYTQVVWKKSLELGCAEVTCTKDPTSLAICLYNPPGSYIGEKPY